MPLWSVTPGQRSRGRPFALTVARTGNSDGSRDRRSAAVLWVYKSQENFVAAPVPAMDVSSWPASAASTCRRCSASTTTPKRRTRRLEQGRAVSEAADGQPPAVFDGKLVFGDGMHQTDGALLHCLRRKGPARVAVARAGHASFTLKARRPLPTAMSTSVAERPASCVSISSRVTLDGKEMKLPAVRNFLDARWKQLQAKYEEDKKKDPCFAVPPSEDQLPKPAPVKLWQVGQKWHVDAPVAVVGGRVLVASAFLDKEKEGDCALYCLDAASGKEKWRAPSSSTRGAGRPWPATSSSSVAAASVTTSTRSRGRRANWWRSTSPAARRSGASRLQGRHSRLRGPDGGRRYRHGDRRQGAPFELATGNRRWIYDAKRLCSPRPLSTRVWPTWPTSRGWFTPST